MRDEMDILREVGSIAAAHGSTALSEMLSRKINLNVPNVHVSSPTNIIQAFRGSGSILVLQTHILTGLKKESLFIVFDEKAAYRIVDICCKIDNIKGSAFTEMAMSLIKEMGSVIVSAYIAALSHFLNKVIIPSMPVLINAPLEELIRLIPPETKEGNAIIIESLFEEPQEKIKGNIWLILTPITAEEIKISCKRNLESNSHKD